MRPKSRKEMLVQIARGMGGVRMAAEVGVLRGAFAWSIRELMKPGELHLVDTWGLHIKTFADYRDYSMEKWEKMYEGVKWKFSCYSDTHIHRGRSTEVATQFDKCTFDFIYIDADHDRLAEDLKAWYPLLKQGGWIAGHDYNLSAVRKDVQAFFKDDYDMTGESTIPSWFHQKK